MRRILPLALVCLSAAPALAAGGLEKRCGWYANPTPGNHFLTDAHGTWDLMLQGGEGAPGFMDLPADSFDFGDHWVETNGNYGYSCACVTGRFGPRGSGVVRLVATMNPLPLSRCLADPALPGAG
ncbi:MAG: DUF4087 domain-containing protein [Cypionkella sp.]|nr:DUF4087 domain-containing protein [Cypionkella sp.]